MLKNIFALIGLTFVVLVVYSLSRFALEEFYHWQPMWADITAKLSLVGGFFLYWLMFMKEEQK